MIRIFIISILLLFSSINCQKDYTDLVHHLQQKIKTDSNFKHAAYKRLAQITDTFGPRLWGSVQLQKAIDYMYKAAQNQQFDNVRLQPVSNFTKWVRGKQSLILYNPRPSPTKLDVIGLGGSISGDVFAEVIVVRTFEQLDQLGVKVKGKIVCYNQQWIDYYKSVQYRVDGASKAAKYGAIGTLVRSIASESISSVHTGYMQYDSKYPKIPAAAITVQDAQMFQRMQSRKQKIVVHLILENQFVPNANSNNLVFQILGQTFPEQVIVAGGHIDSWDTGSQTGANDDGGGFITVFDAFRLLKKNGFKPKRTLRFIAWSGQQSGSDRDGAAQYLEAHLKQMDKHIAAFESDLGSTQLYGFGHTGSGSEIFKQVLTKYMSLINAQNYSDDGFSVDVQPLYNKGVPVIKNLIKDTDNHNYYFRYHHSAGDSMTVMNPDEMDSNVLGISSLLFILADLDTTLRNVQNVQL